MTTPLEPLTLEQRKETLALARDIVANPSSVEATYVVRLAQLVVLMVERSHERVMPVYAAALALARARRASPQWRNWHTERDALDEAARKALELEDRCP